jgi:hypothetical protein
MVEHPDVDERERVSKPEGDLLIGPRGLRLPAGVLMGEDHRGAVVGELKWLHYTGHLETRENSETTRCVQ